MIYNYMIYFHLCPSSQPFLKNRTSPREIPQCFPLSLLSPMLYFLFTPQIPIPSSGPHPTFTIPRIETPPLFRPHSAPIPLPLPLPPLLRPAARVLVLPRFKTAVAAGKQDINQKIDSNSRCALVISEFSEDKS